MIKNLVFILLILPLVISGCQRSEQYIKNEINRANYCNLEEDCVILTSNCPFGCYIAVNKFEADKIKTLINNFKSNCEYMCSRAKEVRCENNKCEI